MFWYPDLELIVEVIKERVSVCIVGQIVDVPVPLLEEIVEVVRFLGASIIAPLRRSWMFWFLIQELIVEVIKAWSGCPDESWSRSWLPVPQIWRKLWR